MSINMIQLTDLSIHPWPRTKQKSRVWETKNILTDAVSTISTISSTDTKKILLLRQNLSKKKTFFGAVFTPFMRKSFQI